jgi:hypothetical protein
MKLDEIPQQYLSQIRPNIPSPSLWTQAIRRPTSPTYFKKKKVSNYIFLFPNIKVVVSINL